MWDAHRSLMRPSDGFPAKLLAVPNEIFQSPFTQLLSPCTPTPAPHISPIPADLPSIQQPVTDAASPAPPEEAPNSAPAPTPPAGPDQPLAVVPPSPFPPSPNPPQSPVLPPDVYNHIIFFLRRPLPPPNGRNPHSAIRQPDLATMMRVSVLFNNLAALHLYSTVVVDNLLAYAHNLGYPPSAAGIPSKEELVGLTRRLFIEYGERRDPTYLQIMQYGQKAYVPIGPDRLVQAAYCRAEAFGIAQAAEVLRYSLRLTSVSLAIFLDGCPHDRWAVTKDPPIPNLEEYIEKANRAVSLFHISPQPSHLCSRGLWGPLSFLSAVVPPPLVDGVPQRHAAHIDMDYEPCCIPPLVGGHTDCYFTFDRYGDPGVDVGMRVLLSVVRSQFKTREHSRTADHAKDVEKSLGVESLSVDLYVPRAWTDSPKWAYANDRLEKGIEAIRAEFGVPESSYKMDCFRLKKLEDAPPCASCGACG